MSTEDVLHALIELRGVDGAVVDLVDGLLLRAEADDVPHAEHRALTDELELIRELAS